MQSVSLTLDELTQLKEAVMLLYDLCSWLGTPPGFTSSDFQREFDAGAAALALLKAKAKEVECN